LLGGHFAEQGIEFQEAYAGSLARQRATGAAVLRAAASSTPIEVDTGWDEFDLAHVYRDMAPHLVRDDPDFAREFAEMQRALVESQGAHDAPVHRRWNDCDRKAVRAWVEARYPFTGEPWAAFVERVQAALGRAAAKCLECDGNVIVFTSATPIGVSAARTLEIGDGRAMWMAAVLFNASFSTLRVRENEVRLFTFNASPHLGSAELRTFR
jgi:broad specificity phosphatase PhoE